MAEPLLHHYLLEITGTFVLPLELQIPTLVILNIQSLLVKTDTIINMDSPLRKGPSLSNLDQGHILGEIEIQYSPYGLSAPIHNIPWASPGFLAKSEPKSGEKVRMSSCHVSVAAQLGLTFPQSPASWVPTC